MKIRQATINDIPKISKLAIKTFDQFVSYAYTKKAAENFRNNILSEKALKERFKTGRKFYVAEISNKIVGVIEFEYTELWLFYVDSDYHHQGIGTKLLKKYESILKKQGGTYIHVNASVHGCPIYQKMGFKMTTGMRKKNGYSYQPMKKILTN